MAKSSDPPFDVPGNLDYMPDLYGLPEQSADFRIPFRGEVQPAETKGLANLADEFRASLADTRRMGYPLEILEPQNRSRVDASCRSMLPILHRAHRMVLDDGFTLLATQLANTPPDRLQRLLMTARLPFSNLWLEWQQPVREMAWIGRNYVRDESIPKKVGVLIWPIGTGDQIFQLVAVQSFQGQCSPAPIGMVFSMTELVQRFERPLDPDNPIQQQRIDECAMGWNYMDAVSQDGFGKLFLGPEQAELAKQLSKHAMIHIAPPLGPLNRETLINAVAEKREDVVDRQQQWLGITAREINGLWRFLIAVFGLYQTGGGEFVVSQSKKQERRMIKGGITLPAYEYRILKLARPTRPEIVEMRLPAVSSGQGRREHTVGVSWHHRRLATAECSRHPKVCEIAIWHRKIDPDTGEGVGKNKDQEECQICHRLRWLVPEHKRGNKELGIVDKGYKIVSSMDEKHVRPSHETVEVVESLPPGVRIKSIPRFDAVTKHGEDSHEHQGGGRHPRTERDHPPRD